MNTPGAENGPHPTAEAAADAPPIFRYPGYVSFGDSDLDRLLFRGRSAESQQVLHSILSEDLFLLYAASGIGKTSLLNAGVMQGLRERGYWPVSVRLNVPMANPTPSIHAQIVEAGRNDDSVEVAISPDAPEWFNSTLWTLLASLEVWRGDDLLQLVLLFDQFEELFTLDWDPRTRAAFIKDLGSVMRGARAAGPDAISERPRSDAKPAVPLLWPQAKILLVIREDSLGELEDLSWDIPQILDNRFRLRPLRRQAAEEALIGPAQLQDARLGSSRFTYDPAAIKYIIGFLETRTGPGRPGDGPFVDPSQLQIISQHIERVILPAELAREIGEVCIGRPSLEGEKGLDYILTAFYRRTLESFPARQQLSIRRLCEKGLITPWRRRRSVDSRELAEQFKVSPKTLDALVDKRLLRAEPRVGSQYYELAHDTLIDPVLSERDRRERRRTRRVAGVAGVAGVAVLVLAVGSSPFASGSRGTLESGGEVLLEHLNEPEEAARFDVGAVRGPAFVTVTGFDGDIRLEVEEDGRTRHQDQFSTDSEPEGESVPERLFLRPDPHGESTREVRVTSPPGDTGEFEISLVSAEPIPLKDALAKDQDLSIANPGEAIVLAVTEPGLLSVVPSSSTESRAGKSSGSPTLNTTMEVVKTTTVRDDSNVDGVGGGRDRAVIGPSGGATTYVVVRGDGGSTGQFRVDARKINSVDVGDRVNSEIGGTTHSYAPPQDAGDYMVKVVPEKFDAVVELIDLGTGVSEYTWDSGDRGGAESFLMPAGVGDPHLILVSGDGTSTGEFSLEVSSVVANQLRQDTSRTHRKLTVFETPRSRGSLFQFRIKGLSAFSPTISGYDRERGSWFWQTFDRPEQGDASALVRGGQTVVVQPRGQKQFEVSLSAALKEGEPDDSPFGPSESVSFDVGVREGEFYETVARTTSPDQTVWMDAYLDYGALQQRTSGATARVLLGEGTEQGFTVVARSDGEFMFERRKLTVEDLVVSGTAAEVGGRFDSPGGAAVYRVIPDENGTLSVSASRETGSPVSLSVINDGRTRYGTGSIDNIQAVRERDFFVVVRASAESGIGTFNLSVKAAAE